MVHDIARDIDAPYPLLDWLLQLCEHGFGYEIAGVTRGFIFQPHFVLRKPRRIGQDIVQRRVSR